MIGYFNKIYRNVFLGHPHKSILQQKPPGRGNHGKGRVDDNHQPKVGRNGSPRTTTIRRRLICFICVFLWVLGKGSSENWPDEKNGKEEEVMCSHDVCWTLQHSVEQDTIINDKCGEDHNPCLALEGIVHRYRGSVILQTFVIVDELLQASAPIFRRWCPTPIRVGIPSFFKNVQCAEV